jgi:ribonuclease BN (tRNA processing enzyme)
MTKLIALGTGSAFTMLGYQTNFLIEQNGKRLLIDCGSDIRFSLKAQGLSFKDIDAVFISHAHNDHCGGLEWLGFTRYFTKQGMISSGCKQPLELPVLYSERNLIKSLWEHSLKGGMESLEGIEANIETYFNIKPVNKNSYFIWEGLQFDLVQSIHVSSKYSYIDSFGLMFTSDTGKRIYLTTDLQFCSETSLKAYYCEADIIIHDCETAFKSGVHAHYNDLKTLPIEIKNKILLVHYQDNVVEDIDIWQTKAKDDGFQGFAVPGIIFS